MRSREGMSRWSPAAAASCGDGGGERVMVPVRLLGDPSIAELLDMAAQQYGFGQPGVLRVPATPGISGESSSARCGGAPPAARRHDS
ncbi:hypothetical protein OsJ_11984 [Oryza sativa Japonica Group]|uniref:Uncharacterized protein n=1 Tax=Oryza sativa subsp. japonica TaxID=39947 RepID=B9FA54_ORYSJ|nr:hypothetical protein OsJ_11984 [Oryza sativa Japonica Group]